MSDVTGEPVSNEGDGDGGGGAGLCTEMCMVGGEMLSASAGELLNPEIGYWVGIDGMFISHEGQQMCLIASYTENRQRPVPSVQKV